MQTKVNSILKNNWLSLSRDEKTNWKKWEEWDSKRYNRDLETFENAPKSIKHEKKSPEIITDNNAEEVNDIQRNPLAIPKKIRVSNVNTSDNIFHIPKKSKKRNLL